MSKEERGLTQIEAQKQDKKLNLGRFKRWQFWAKATGVIILISLIYNVGQDGAEVTLGDKKVDYYELVANIDSKQGELDTIQDKLSKINQEYSDKQEEFDAVKEVIANKDTAKSELTDLTNKVDSKIDEISDLDKQIEAKEKELHTLEGKIIKAIGEPITLGAGQYIVGSDIPSGRYKAEPVGRGSNFFVYGNNGTAIVNTILGDGDFGETEYNFFTNEGEIIQTEAKITLTPIE